MWQFFKFNNDKKVRNPSLWEKAKALVRHTYSQIDEPNYFLELEILKLAYKICLSIEDGLKFDSSEACKPCRLCPLDGQFH